MASDVRVNARVELFGRVLGTVGETTPVEPIRTALEQLFTHGTGAGQATVFWSAQGTVGVEGVTYDLQDGSQTDSEGNALVLTSLRALYVQNRHATYTLQVRGDCGNVLVLPGTAEHYMQVKPGGAYLWIAPAGAAVSASADVIILEGTTGVTYTVAALGVTA